MENNKYKNTVVVNVLEDFNPLAERTKKSDIKKSKLIYKKGSKHSIHKKLLAKLEAKGLKFKKIDFDFRAVEKKAADKLKASKSK
jgi:predicted transcriptional regulator